MAAAIVCALLLRVSVFTVCLAVAVLGSRWGDWIVRQSTEAILLSGGVERTCLAWLC